MLESRKEEWQNWKTQSLGPGSTSESCQCLLHSTIKGVLSVFYMPVIWDSCHALHEIPFHYVQSWWLLWLRSTGALSPLPVWESWLQSARLGACILQLARPLVPPGPLQHPGTSGASSGSGVELLTRGKASLPRTLGLP